MRELSLWSKGPIPASHHQRPCSISCGRGLNPGVFVLDPDLAIFSLCDLKHVCCLSGLDCFIYMKLVDDLGLLLINIIKLVSLLWHVVPDQCVFFFLFFFRKGLMQPRSLRTALKLYYSCLHLLSAGIADLSAGDQTQGFLHARQTLDQPSYPSPTSKTFFFFCSISWSLGSGVFRAHFQMFHACSTELQVGNLKPRAETLFLCKLRWDF